MYSKLCVQLLIMANDVPSCKKLKQTRLIWGTPKSTSSSGKVNNADVNIELQQQCEPVYLDIPSLSDTNNDDNTQATEARQV